MSSDTLDSFPFLKRGAAILFVLKLRQLLPGLWSSYTSADASHCRTFLRLWRKTAQTQPVEVASCPWFICAVKNADLFNHYKEG